MQQQARRSGYRKSVTLVSAMGVLAFADTMPARAVDWSLRLQSSTDMELTDNLSGVKKGKDAALKTTENLSLDLLARTKVSLFRITPAISTRPTFLAETPPQLDLFPSLGIGYSYTGKLTSIDLNTYIARSPITADDLLLNTFGIPVLDQKREPIVRLTDSGSEFSYGASISVSRKLTALDSISWSANYDTTDYSIDVNTLEPSSSVTTSLDWNHNLTKLISMSASTTLSYYMPVDKAKNDRLTISPNLGVSGQLTKRLSGSAKLGLSYNDEKDQKPSIGAVAAVSAVYSLKTTKFNFSASRDISAKQSGDLRDRYNLELGASHQLNDLTTIALKTSFAYSPVKNAADEQAFSISPSISYQLAKDWNTSLAYSLSESNEGGGSSFWTNAVMFNLSYGKTLLK